MRRRRQPPESRRLASMRARATERMRGRGVKCVGKRFDGFGRPRRMPTIRTTPGSSTSTTATTTTTIRVTTTLLGWCAGESDVSPVFTFRAVERGYRDCRRRKRGTANAQRYELRLLDHLVDTAEALQSRRYAPARSLCFIARRPKAREIHAAAQGCRPGAPGRCPASRAWAAHCAPRRWPMPISQKRAICVVV